MHGMIAERTAELNLLNKRIISVVDTENAFLAV